jgi:hypothetical protein
MTALPGCFGIMQCLRDADESSGDAGPHNNTGQAPPALSSKEASDGPTARIRTPHLRPRHFVAGERLATEKGSLGIRCWKAFPPIPLPFPNGEEGGPLSELIKTGQHPKLTP